MKHVLFGLFIVCCILVSTHAHGGHHEDELVFDETEYVFESCGCGHDHDHGHDHEHEHHHDHSHDQEEEDEHFHPDLAKRIQALEDKDNIRRVMQLVNRRIENWLEDKIDLDILCEQYYTNDIEYDFGTNGKVKGCENVVKTVYQGLWKSTYKSVRQITVDTLIDVEGNTAYSLWTSILATTDTNGVSSWVHLYKEIEWEKSEEGYWMISSEAPKKSDIKL